MHDRFIDIDYVLSHNANEKSNTEPIDIDNNSLSAGWSIGDAVLYVKGILAAKYRIRK